MLYALASPISFALLLVSFLVAVTVHGWVQSLAAHRAGERGLAAEGRLRPDPRRHVDPFGAIAAAIAGLGWARPVELPRSARRSAVVAVSLAGVVANAVLGVVALVGFRLAGGAVSVSSTLSLQRGVDGDIGLRALLLFGLMNVFVAALSLVPLPPLPGGRLLFTVGPRGSGWQKARYYLVEQNIGVAVVLALLIIPLAGAQALLPSVLDAVFGPAVQLLTRG